MVIGYWLLVIGYWLLVIGYWLLVIGYWLLVIGYWLLVIEVPLAHCVRGGMVRGVSCGRGKKKGGGRKGPSKSRFFPAALLFPPLTPK
jgi:hypothetical protein